MKVRARVVWTTAASLVALLLAGCPQDVPSSDSKDDSSTTAPRVDAVTPNHGSTGGGTRVTIIGGPFESQIGVLFGAYAAVDPIIVNAHMITAITPPQAAGLVDVTVLSNGGQTTVVGAFRYEATRVDIISISPDQGGTGGGTAVTITGQNFSPGTVVRIGGELAGSIAVLNPQLITAVTPAHAAGWVSVQVISEGTEDSLNPEPDPNDPTDRLRGFEYILPTVTSIEPAFGPVEGGTLVTIRGMQLPDGAGILFGGVASPQVTRITDGLITAIVPPGASAGTVDITIVYPDGEIVIPDAFEYTDGLPLDDGTDTDGDGLTDVQEQIGWEVWIENFGLQLGVDTFGNVTRYNVTSDPTLVDTDGDGLNDNVEMLIRSDPRKLDSDDDGLQDGEEWNQWLTSPTSVDTDADARGDRNMQNAPNQALFDGLELFDAAVLRLPQGDPLRVVRARATSPTLFDTDADGVSDFDEYDSTVRNSVIADLPRLDYQLVGDVDVRLNVEYAETIGETSEYGTTLTKSETNTVASEFSHSIGWSVEVSVEQEIEYGPLDFGGTTIGITAGVNGEYTWTNSNETSKEASEEHSRLQSDSRERTETASSGSIRTSILLTNNGNTTFTVGGLSVLVMQREKLKAEGDVALDTPLKTIATMRPIFETEGLDPVRPTLAPGEAAGPFELVANEISAAAIKELLARPDSLLLGTASMNFLDANGLDFDFIRQYTLAQTANVTVDYGDGEVRTFVVATNVDRNPDSTYRGIPMRRVMREVLGLPADDAINGYTTMLIDATGRRVLQSLLGRQFAAGATGARRDYWVTVTNNPEHENTDFDDIVLKAGDYIHLMYSRDDDDDGLSNTLEKAAGTDQGPPGPDADGDGLTDKFESVTGWIAFEDPSAPDAPHPDGFQKRRVFPSPTSADSDDDGLGDAQEFAARSNPLDPDTDGDGLLDGQDPKPIRRAGVRFVSELGVDPAPGVDNRGRTWDTAYRTIQRALLDAAGNPHADPANDVSQVWVARGTYKPSTRTSPIALVNNVGVYGGFSGPNPDTGFLGEGKRGQRNINAFSNGCVISGDLSSNDTGTMTLDSPGTYTDNCPVIVSAGPGLTTSAVLDGFMITAAYSQTGNSSGALNLQGSPTIQNCLILRNASQNSGAGAALGPASAAVFKRCIFAGNLGKTGGGAFVGSNLPVVFDDCEFSQNIAARIGTNDDNTAAGGGVAALSASGRVDFNRCVFTGNSAWTQGGGIYASGASLYVRIDSCRFNDNAITTIGWLGNWRGVGGGCSLDANSSISNSTFWNNGSKQIGGAIAVISGSGNPGDGWWNGPVRRCTITNCTISNNRAWISGGNSSGGGVATAGRKSNVVIQNSILWGNWYGADPLPDSPNYEEHLQVYDWNWPEAISVVNNSCVNGGAPFRWRGVNGNVNDDPSLNNLELGDLRLGGSSPCVDRGSTFVDLDPLLPGLQPLPQFDLFGNRRIVDGNGDAIVSVDIGAYEVQPGQQ